MTPKWWDTPLDILFLAVVLLAAWTVVPMLVHLLFRVAAWSWGLVS